MSAGAAALLRGETVDQIEANATAFARLVHTAGHNLQNEPETAGRNIFAEAAAGKQHRKQELHRLITGRRARQPRDEHGRFAGSLDGGARPLGPRAPATGEPLLAEHGRWLGQVIAQRRADCGAAF